MGFYSNQTLIIGVGLLGSSIGLALKKHNLAGKVVGAGRRVESLSVAKKLGAIDEYSLELQDYVKDSDFIVICTPVRTSINILKEIHTLITPDIAITDVCSTKYSICSTAKALWKEKSPFVGSHPIAGSEKFGPEHGRADFYENSICFVEKKINHNEEAHKRVVSFWKRLGADVIEISPEEHDFYLCYSSHLPHVVASSLAKICGTKGLEKQFIGKGFIDTTRIAESRPELWTDISLTNRNNLIKSISEFIQNMEYFKKALEENNEEKITEFFTQGKENRKRILGQ